MKPFSNGLDDLFGLVHLAGGGNTVTGNHLVASGANNYIAANNTVASVAVNTVVLDGSTTGTKVLDSGTTGEFVHHTSSYSFRATP